MKSWILAAALGCAIGVASPARAQEHKPPDDVEGPHDAGKESPAEAAHQTHHSPFELRVSVEAPLYLHDSDASASTNIFKTVDLGVSLMGSYVISHQLSIDVEITESFLLAAENAEEGAPKRSGTTLRIGGAYSPSADRPFYVTALTTYHLEPSPFVFGLRLGVGTDFHLAPSARYFVELDFDFPIASGDGGPGFFKQQAVVLSTGVLFHLP